MKHTLRFRLTAAFLLITMIAFSLIGVFANVILERQFEKYVIDNLDKKRNEIVTTLESRYGDWGNKWDLSGLDNLGVSALSDGLILRVSDNDETVLWDAMTHNSGLCTDMLQGMSENMERQNAGFDGGYTEKNYQLIVSDAVVGNVTIGYYGPYFYTDNDISFLNTLNKLLILATAIAGVLSFLLGSYMAKLMQMQLNQMQQMMMNSGMFSMNNMNGTSGVMTQTTTPQSSNMSNMGSSGGMGMMSNMGGSGSGTMSGMSGSSGGTSGSSGSSSSGGMGMM